MIEAIEAAVRGQLLTALAGAAPVYLHQAPQEAGLPCVVIEAALVGGAAEGGSAPLQRLEVQTACYARTHAAAEAVAGVVRGALAGWMFGGAGVRVFALELAGVDPGYEQEWDEHRLGLTWGGLALIW